jgi:hypothetical protein
MANAQVGDECPKKINNLVFKAKCPINEDRAKYYGYMFDSY